MARVSGPRLRSRALSPSPSSSHDSRGRDRPGGLSRGIRAGAPAGQEGGVRASRGDRDTSVHRSARPPGHQRKLASSPQGQGMASCALGSWGPRRGEAGGEGRGRGEPTLPRAARPAAHNHVLQGVLGQPAVQKHRDEQVPQWWPEYLRRRRVRGRGLGGPFPSWRLTHRDDEGQRVDHLQDEGHTEDLLPDVALGSQAGGLQSRWAGRGAGGGV